MWNAEDGGAERDATKWLPASSWLDPETIRYANSGMSPVSDPYAWPDPRDRPDSGCLPPPDAGPQWSRMRPPDWRAGARQSPAEDAWQSLAGNPWQSPEEDPWRRTASGQPTAADRWQPPPQHHQFGGPAAEFPAAWDLGWEPPASGTWSPEPRPAADHADYPAGWPGPPAPPSPSRFTARTRRPRAGMWILVGGGLAAAATFVAAFAAAGGITAAGHQGTAKAPATASARPACVSPGSGGH